MVALTAAPSGRRVERSVPTPPAGPVDERRFAQALVDAFEAVLGDRNKCSSKAWGAAGIFPAGAVHHAASGTNLKSTEGPRNFLVPLLAVRFD